MSRKEDYSKDVWAFVMPSFVGVYESSLRRAVFACYHRKDKQPPKLTRKPPVFLQFEDATVEDAYHEWSGAENSRKTLRSLGVILLCLGMYYWATDWVNWVQEGSSDSIKRLVSRGCILVLGFTLYPSFVSISNLSMSWRLLIRLMAANGISILIFWRIYLESHDMIFIRSAAIWSVFLKALVLLVGQHPVQYYAVFNVVDSTAHLVLHHVFRPMSLQSIIPWEILAFVTLQVYSYLADWQSREEFLRCVVSWLHREVGEEVADIHDFVEQHTNTVVTLLRVPSRNEGHIFQFVSRSSLALLGWHPSEMVGRPVEDFVSEDNTNYIRRMLKGFQDTVKWSNSSAQSVTETGLEEAHIQVDDPLAFKRLYQKRQNRKCFPEEEWDRALEIHERLSSCIVANSEQADQILPRERKLGTETEKHVFRGHEERIDEHPDDGRINEDCDVSREKSSEHRRVVSHCGTNSATETQCTIISHSGCSEELPLPGTLAKNAECEPSQDALEEMKDPSTLQRNVITPKRDTSDSEGSSHSCSDEYSCKILTKSGKAIKAEVSFKQSPNGTVALITVPSCSIVF
eukprot:gb/GECG01014971.1/.p1 GENE.gb/GECG01014971.1/~~gb/GECG01014971.1/.p1  ORF type:complete len:573 (+),score=57.28 gb/GECG01014971.1/:1-1719(+)